MKFSEIFLPKNFAKTELIKTFMGVYYSPYGQIEAT